MEIFVVGGGPAGMMAAAKAAEKNHVTLLEKNPSLGKKLLLTGGGRCNFTNAEPDNHRLAAFYGQAGRFLLSPLSRFSASDALKFFSLRGMPYKIEDRNRAFPVSNESRSVLTVLEEYLRETCVSIKTHTEVTGLLVEEGRCLGVQTRRGPLRADHVILATGGTSLPATGSTGDGYRWLKEAGHTVRIPEPSLVPLAVTEKWVQELAGLSFDEVRLEAWHSQRAFAETGRLLLTHVGLSGPLVLNAATRLAALHREAQAQGRELVLRLDFFPRWDGGELDRQLVALIAETPNRLLKSLLSSWLPPRLVHRVLTLTQLPEVPGRNLTKEERQRLGRFLKGFPLTFKRLLDASKAVVSSGGVSLKEVDFRTMKSLKVQGLSLVGDLLDFDRPTGGFSLQICWTTAWTAGLALGTEPQGLTSD